MALYQKIRRDSGKGKVDGAPGVYAFKNIPDQAGLDGITNKHLNAYEELCRINDPQLGNPDKAKFLRKWSFEYEANGKPKPTVFSYIPQAGTTTVTEEEAAAATNFDILYRKEVWKDCNDYTVESWYGDDPDYHVYEGFIGRLPTDDSTALVMVWDTRNNNANGGDGSGTDKKKVRLPLVKGEIYDTVTVDWGDGQTTLISGTYKQGDLAANIGVHEYVTKGPKVITITGTTFGGLKFETEASLALGDSYRRGSDRLKLLNIKQWGCFEFLQRSWSTGDRDTFRGCANLQVHALDIPAVRVNGCFNNAFRDCTSLCMATDDPASGYDDYSVNSWIQWQTENAIQAKGMFNGSSFNSPIANWDTSGITDMKGMFQNATLFNQRIDTKARHGSWRWNVASVYDFTNMFKGAAAFNQPLRSWNMDGGFSCKGMFEGATSFNRPLIVQAVNPGDLQHEQVYTTWKMPSVIGMDRMFKNATSFNGNIDNWNVQNVTSASSMFEGATSFNRPIKSKLFHDPAIFEAGATGEWVAWQFDQCNTFNSMFKNATAFKQSIQNWKTTSVTDMGEMFSGTCGFEKGLDTISRAEGDLGTYPTYQGIPGSQSEAYVSWDVSNVSNMRAMFKNNVHFNKPLDKWDVMSLNDCGDMFRGATSFNQKVNSWLYQTAPIFFDNMFNGATSFDQDITKVNIGSSVDKDYGLKNFLTNCGISVTNYGNWLVKYVEGKDIVPQTGVEDFSCSAKYPAFAAAARATLVKPEGQGGLGWLNVTDGGPE